MSDTADESKPWYEVLLEAEQKVNTKLNTLCERQQRLIEQLERKLLETGNIADSLSSSSSVEPQLELGPASFPVRWTGSTSDCIPVSVGGQTLKAMILTKDTISQWNQVMQILPRIAVYETALGDELVSIKTYETYIKEADERKTAGRPADPRIARYREWMREVNEGLEKHIRPQLWDFYATIAGPQNSLSCKMHHLFKSQGILANSQHDWKERLRSAGLLTEREDQRVREADVNYCSFCRKLQ
jgi:hypothetical protein